MRCKKCGGIMFSDMITTKEGTITLFRCIVCGKTTDMLSEINKITPPKPPEKRGRKPSLLAREIKRAKPILRKSKKTNNNNNHIPPNGGGYTLLEIPNTKRQAEKRKST